MEMAAKFSRCNSLSSAFWIAIRLQRSVPEIRRPLSALTLAFSLDISGVDCSALLHLRLSACPLRLAMVLLRLRIPKVPIVFEGISVLYLIFVDIPGSLYCFCNDLVGVKSFLLSVSNGSHFSIVASSGSFRSLFVPSDGFIVFEVPKVAVLLIGDISLLFFAASPHSRQTLPT
jgi:hypothetical protein